MTQFRNKNKNILDQSEINEQWETWDSMPEIWDGDKRTAIDPGEHAAREAKEEAPRTRNFKKPSPQSKKITSKNSQLMFALETQIYQRFMRGSPEI